MRSSEEVFLAVDSDGRPYVAFSQDRRVAKDGNMDLSNRVTYVMKYTGRL